MIGRIKYRFVSFAFMFDKTHDNRVKGVSVKQPRYLPNLRKMFENYIILADVSNVVLEGVYKRFEMGYKN